MIKTILQYAAILACAATVAPEGIFARINGLDPEVASYRATRILQFDGRTYTLLERRAMGKLRLDSCPEARGCTYIVRDDLNETFTIGPRSYVRGGYPGPYDPRWETFEVTDSKIVANEKVGGYPAEKYRATFKLAHGQVGDGFYWIHKGIMIRVDLRYTTSDGSLRQVVMELQNLEIAKQDPAQFDVPPGLSDITNII